MRWKRRQARYRSETGPNGCNGRLERAEEVDPEAEVPANSQGEKVFWFNNRAYTDRDRFLMVLGSVSGERLLYDTLTRSYKACYVEITPQSTHATMTDCG